MESPLLGLILDSSVIIAAERKRQTVEELLTFVGQSLGEIEIAYSAVTLAELVHGVVRANTPEIRATRRGFIDELKKHVPAPHHREHSGNRRPTQRRAGIQRASRSRPMIC